MAAAALLTIALSGWTAWHDMSGPPVEARAPRLRLVPAPGLEQAAQAEGDIGRDGLIDAASDPFRVVSFLPPAPKVIAAPAPMAPPPPVAPQPVRPPFPYVYFGRMVDVHGKQLTYLSRDEGLIPVNEQQILDNVYRIDAIREREISVTYLPLNEKTVIPAGSAQER